jgi:hypothetical protein
VIVAKIIPNMKIPGTTLQHEGKAAIKFLVADSDATPNYPLKIVAKAEKFNPQSLVAVLQNLNASLDPTIFSLCLAFLPFPGELSASASLRPTFYAARNSPKLSTILNARAAGPVELAILGQAALQAKGMSSWYIGGARLNLVSTEPYSYVVIEDRGTSYIWDAANPINTSGGGLMPRLFRMPRDFRTQIEQAKATLLCKGSNIFVRAEEVFFGVKL